MALFPAYGCGDVDPNILAEELVVAESASEGSSGCEARLLASDSDGECTPRAVRTVRAPSPPRLYYEDVRPERGNLAVSTLYCPGRPQYRRAEHRRVMREMRARRYYEAATPGDSRAEELEELAARAAAFLRALTDNPRDEPLWLQYIEFEEACCEGEAALRAAQRALTALPESRALRVALHRARVRLLPPSRLLATLREHVTTPLAPGGGDDLTQLEAWLRLLAALAANATHEDFVRAASAALVRLRRIPSAYPYVLYAYGAFLRDAGLWERLVLLVELVAAMNFPAGVFPPGTPDTALIEQQDRDLATFEDKAIASGLPLNTVWVRVERARAAAHWRPAPPCDMDPDPQRRVLPADVADLLQPIADPDAAFLLSVQLLRLTKVPLFPPAEYLQRAVTAAGLTEEEMGAAWVANSAEAFLPLIRTARRLPPAHPARPVRAALARDLLSLLLDPPHYFTDRAGYLSWVNALWEASCEWARGEQRLALLCWRLRWSHALLMLLDTEVEEEGSEVRRIVSEARGALKRHAGGSPVAYAQFARIHVVAAGAERGRQTALHALRAALGDPACPVTHRLYVARIAGELARDLGAWPVLCAVLGVALPEHFTDPPHPDLLGRAALLCEERCAALEARCASGGRSGGVCAALLPGAAEWAGARLAFASPGRVRRVLRDVLRRRTEEPMASSEEELRYLEQSACGIVCVGARNHQLAQRARILAHHFPHNGLLALANSGSPLSACAWETQGDGTAPQHRLRALTASARTHTAAHAHLLPPLWRALCTADPSDSGGAWHPQEAERVRRACERGARLGCGGALLQAVALEAGARGGGAHARLLRALDASPNHKWMYVRGAALEAGAGAGAQVGAALPDLLLERQLRLHALRDELQPLHQ